MHRYHAEPGQALYFILHWRLCEVSVVRRQLYEEGMMVRDDLQLI